MEAGAFSLSHRARTVPPSGPTSSPVQLPSAPTVIERYPCWASASTCAASPAIVASNGPDGLAAIRDTPLSPTISCGGRLAGPANVAERNWCIWPERMSSRPRGGWGAASAKAGSETFFSIALGFGRLRVFHLARFHHHHRFAGHRLEGRGGKRLGEPLIEPFDKQWVAAGVTVLEG